MAFVAIMRSNFRRNFQATASILVLPCSIDSNLLDKMELTAGEEPNRFSYGFPGLSLGGMSEGVTCEVVVERM